MLKVLCKKGRGIDVQIRRIPCRGKRGLRAQIFQVARPDTSFSFPLLPPAKPPPDLLYMISRILLLLLLPQSCKGNSSHHHHHLSRHISQPCAKRTFPFFVRERRCKRLCFFAKVPDLFGATESCCVDQTLLPWSQLINYV